MEYYCGLDVSMQETFITILSSEGEVLIESSVSTEVKDIANFLLSLNIVYKKIGIESGQFSIHLCKGLRRFDLKCYLC